MPRLLEDLRPGTTVYDGSGGAVGEIRAVYGAGEARTAEFLLIYWHDRAEEALIPADEAMSVANDGVHLRQSADAYAERPAFDPAANPLLHRL